MKKVIMLFLGIILYASSNEEFLDYTNKLVTYNFELKHIDKMKSPFYKPKKFIFFKNKMINKNIKKIVHITLFSIFNNSALIKIEEYMGDEIVKRYKKWVKTGDKIENCYIKTIYFNKMILKCGRKILVKKINEKSLNIRIEQ